MKNSETTTENVAVAKNGSMPKWFNVGEDRRVSVTLIAQHHVTALVQFVTHAAHPHCCCLITHFASMLMITLQSLRRSSSWHPKCVPLLHHANAQYSLFSQDEDGLLNKAINTIACNAGYWAIFHYAALTINDGELHLMNLLCNKASFIMHLSKGAAVFWFGCFFTSHWEQCFPSFTVTYINT